MNQVVYEIFSSLAGTLAEYELVAGGYQFYLRLDADQDTRAGFECRVVDGVESHTFPISSQAFDTCKEELGMRRLFIDLNAPVFYLLPGDCIWNEKLTSPEFLRQLGAESRRRKLRLLAA